MLHELFPLPKMMTFKRIAFLEGKEVKGNMVGERKRRGERMGINPFPSPLLMNLVLIIDLYR